MPRSTRPPPDRDATGAREETTTSSKKKGRSGYSLLVSSEDGVAVHALNTTQVTIGRGAECEVKVNDGSMSRRHARLLIEEALTLEDLGSTNGTRVQGRRIERGDRVAVALGTVFELGSATFVLQRTRGLAPAKTATVTAATRTVAPPRLDGPVVHDPTMRHLYALLDVIAPTPLHVLVLGETGSGKEVFAEAIHKRSDRSERPLLKLNCAALPQSTLEGELFGYERGAFTSAVQAKAGLFESADGGTVFLDEIAEIPVETQAKLLRVLESGEVMRLGALRTTKVDVRFIAATNRDLRQRIVEGAFRADLFFRLNGMMITLPPLRKRTADIAPLARHLLDKIALKMKRPSPRLTDGAVAWLEAYTWPGNVREMRNVLERTFVMARGEEAIDERHLERAAPEAFGDAAGQDPMTTEMELPVVRGDRPSPLSRPAIPRAPSVPAIDGLGRGGNLREEMRDLEKQRIVGALAGSGGNQSEAAKALGISRYTLMARMEQYGIARPRKKT